MGGIVWFSSWGMLASPGAFAVSARDLFHCMRTCKSAAAKFFLWGGGRETHVPKISQPPSIV